MKRLYLIICLLLVSGFAFSQWEWQNSLPQGNSLSCVRFVNENTGYAVGSVGTILKTTNAGINWISQTSGTNADLSSVCFIDSVNGYSVGSEGTILKTVDGGNHWIAQLSGTLEHLWSVYFIDANTGYVVGNHVIILKTTDGGKNWVVQSYDNNKIYRLTSVFFTDTNNGFAVYDVSVIKKTTDGGVNWTDHYIGFNTLLYSAYFTDSKTGYVVGGDGYGCYAFINCKYRESNLIVKTIDGGLNWTVQLKQLTDSSSILNSVYFTNANTGYAVGNRGEILKTTDGGTNWSVQASGTTDKLNSVYFTNSNTGYVVGEGGTILKTTNGGGFPTSVENISPKSTFTVYPNPATNKINITTSSNPQGDTMICIFDMNGAILQQDKFQSQNLLEMDVSELAKGVYLVKIQTKKGIETKKLVVQ